ncbi:MAG: phosphoribosylamine--glycine ligase [Sulfolobales archaeon]|nr:phosphoribosylamine--glycine ligase [Sulfolobales archaeon]MCX8186356.1 phosphoribosylamine--glycine ligase [Sulfolobales archaeon]MDW7968908.1 phosphoribosylamine--glycine ligase [Sulfolobales archaeon]
MKVVVLGDGSREHTITILLSRSCISPKIYVLSSYRNPGLKKAAEDSGGQLFRCNILSPSEVKGIVDELSPDLIIIGPEEPQFHGVVDTLVDGGYAVFGATRKLAEIEKSKVFMRDLMWRFKIPGRLAFKAFTDVNEAMEYIENAGDVVIKPARQAGGKGVKVIADLQAYLSDIKSEIRREYAKKLISDVMTHYTDIDYKLLIEERVDGVEYTLMTITDGHTVLPLPLVQDHPHAFDNDLGPETGGMGSIQGPGYILPFINQQEYQESIEIIKSTLKALQTVVNDRYVGVLSGQMMLTPIWGPTVIEFYSRFGDPEVVNLLHVLDTDFLDIVEAAVSRKLASIKLKVRDDLVTVAKVVSPKGYPNNRRVAKGHPISVDEGLIRSNGCEVLYAGVELGSDGNLYTTGSRIATILCSGSNYKVVSDVANKCAELIKCIDGWDTFYRSDIGSESLVSERMRLAEAVRDVYTYRRKNNLVSIKVDWIPGRGATIYDYR